MEKVKIGGILQGLHLAKITLASINDRPGVAAIVFETLGRERINVEFIVHAMDERGCSHLTFCVDRKDLPAAMGLMLQNKEEVGFSELVDDPDVGLLSIFGPHFRERPGIAGIVFRALARAGINVMAISTSISTCSCLIASNEMPHAVRVLSETFELPGA